MTGQSRTEIRPTKICHVSFSLFPIDPRVRRYVNALLNRGYKVYVICMADDVNPKYESYQNLEIHRLSVSKKRTTYPARVFEYLKFFTIAFFKCIELFLKHRIKLFHMHSLPDFIVFTALIPKIFGAEIILDLHELTPEAMMMRENMSEKNLMIRFTKLIEKISVKTANAHITIHEIAAQILSIRNKVQFIPIMNGIDEVELEGITRYTTADFNIVYHGTININLNLTIVIDALEKLRLLLPVKEFRHIKFLLYGSGPALTGLLDRTKQLDLQENVISNGWLNHSEMMKELCKASVCVYPPVNNIYTELCYPVKLTELINIGIPVIASRYKTLNYYYPEDCFFYFEPGNLDELVRQLLIVKNNPELVDKKIKLAKQAYDKISWNKIMKERYLDLIYKLG